MRGTCRTCDTQVLLAICLVVHVSLGHKKMSEYRRE